MKLGLSADTFSDLAKFENLSPFITTGPSFIAFSFQKIALKPLLTPPLYFSKSYKDENY